ncbi:MAG: hypothetical protein CEN91_113 [Candidatus Berkelbacteria bacterium Licking1014_85]|uniref:Antitoxin n=1 Tax=Candidatus Berkelbacteria bacterium Licking1014_85 TaxID=2017148 RepID=A0A554LLR8_9BACT|nr:MAG: hypothetical protein CEN91_113 [Candidatus Berkelbacteria bacterium Licking1014_85]
MNQIIGLKNLRENTKIYIDAIEKGASFIVLQRSKPIFKITPIDTESNWKEMIDFTKIKKGGVEIKQLLSRL